MRSGIKNIRKYFEERLKEIDKSFVELKKTNDDNVPRTQLNKKFHILYGDLSGSTLNHNCTKDTIDIIVSLHFAGYKDAVAASDDGYEFANRYRLHCMKPEFTCNQDFIKKVYATRISPKVNDTNQTSIEFEITFSVGVVFGTEDDYAPN